MPNALEMPDVGNRNANAAGSLFDLASCQGRDYRLPIMMNRLMMTLRDKEDLQLWRHGITVTRRPKLLKP